MNLNEEKLSLSDIKHLYSTYKKKYAKAKADKDAKEGKKPKKGEKSKSDKDAPRFKSKKKKQGGREFYNYDEYREKNPIVDKGSMTNIVGKIDMERTNIASVARDVFPDLTDEGAQSELRKILLGERPMTRHVAEKLSRYAMEGKIALK